MTGTSGAKKRTIDQYFAKSPKKLAPTAQQDSVQTPAPAVDAPPQQIAEALAPASTAETLPANTAEPALQSAPQPSPSAAPAPAAPAAVTNNKSPAAAWPISSAPAAAKTATPGLLVDLLQEPSWRAALEGELRKPYFASLQAFVQGELAPGKPRVYPPREAIFRAFNSCPFDDVKVVILGQDPYHGAGQATGLSFSVPPGIPTPSSLQNIFKEIEADLGLPRPNHGNLEKWAAQGVLLLNAVLTVRAGEPASHAKKGWEQLTDAAIKALATKRSGIVFLLWGNFAKGKAALIPAARHCVLEAAHPSGLSASRGFFGCRHFSKANAYLQGNGQQPIDWKIERV